jgi:hypothetical protein
MSEWKISVATEVIESRLVAFLPILRMTRDVSKFPAWNAKTVEKAFKWAEYVRTVSTDLDIMQKNTLLDKGLLGSTEVVSLESNPLSILDDPVGSLVTAIFTSPYLHQLQYPTQVLEKSLEFAVLYMKSKETVVTRVVEILQECVQFRVSMASQISTDTRNRPFPSVDEISLAMELVVALYDLRMKNDDAVFQQKVKSIKQLMSADLLSLRLLCCILVLSPSMVACAHTVFAFTRNDYGSKGSGELDDTKEGWLAIYLESKSQYFVDMLTQCIRSDIMRFVSIDEDSSVMKALCSLEGDEHKEKNGIHFTHVFEEVLLATLCSYNAYSIKEKGDDDFRTSSLSLKFAVEHYINEINDNEEMRKSLQVMMV